MNRAHRLSPQHRLERLWAITAYFNPFGSGRRLANYRAFLQRLSVPLVTVELSFNGKVQLHEKDADIVVSLDGRDVLWQKERLLNIALQHLPDQCDTVAWLDGDIIFGGNDWPRRARKKLEKSMLVQLFTVRNNLSRHSTIDDLDPASFDRAEESVAFRHIAGSGADGNTELPRASKALPTVYGAGWAGRRELLERHGLYDACILGGGDRAILNAALGEFDDVIARLHLSEEHAKHYLRWARPFFETVRGRIDYIEEQIYHLWHGHKMDRQYRQRHADFNSFDFNPSEDITIDSVGCWRWSSDKRDLHRYVEKYFKLRNEDGLPR